MIYTKATLIISVYNNIKALETVLDSVQRQTVKNFEVIISEDGQHDLVKEFLKDYKYEGDLTHLSHPDNGWQKNIALNKAIRRSKSDYLVFIDGDCVLHPAFMEYHLKLANPEHILAGKRIKLDYETSNMLQRKKISTDRMNRSLLSNFKKIKKNGARFIEEGFFINPDGILGFIPQLRSMYQLKGCNMSFPKKAIYDINGFDEDYIRPAIGEDIDLTWRFEKAGYKISSVRNMAVQYHLHHEENWTDQSENVRMMKSKQEKDQFVCLNGLKKA